MSEVLSGRSVGQYVIEQLTERGWQPIVRGADLDAACSALLRLPVSEWSQRLVKVLAVRKPGSVIPIPEPRPRPPTPRA